MPQDIFETNEVNTSVAKSTALMSTCILISRLTGFIRTWAMAFALGNTVLAASFSLANNLPNMIYELVAGGILSTAFLPIYMQQLNKRSDEKANLYANNLLNITVLVLGIIALLGSIFAPQIMATQTMFSNADSQVVSQAIVFFRFFSFQIIFYGISAIIGGILNAKRKYFWPAICSVFMNIISIATFFTYPFFDGQAQTQTLILGIGITLSVAVMAFVQILALIKSGHKFQLVIDFKGEGLRDTLKLALPAIFCTCTNLIALSFMNSCALNVSDNGPASIQYAWMWYQFPYGVLSVAFSTAMFTEMSESFSKNNIEKFKDQFIYGFRNTLILIVPMAALLVVCSFDLIGLYSAGKFTFDQIQPISHLLSGWGFVLPLYALYMFIYRAYSSIKSLKTVAIVNFCFTIIQVLIYLTLTGVITPQLSLGLLGIPCGDFVFYGCVIIVLCIILKNKLGKFNYVSLFKPLVKVIIASIAGALVCFFVSYGYNFIFGQASGTLQFFVELLVMGVCGLLITYLLCYALKVEEICNFVQRLKQKFINK
ncbi:MAG: murein biosynthesis integral membrane protein MurJ [Coriobacteriales bacterium]|nr:murein biosynthesis integral membrane protein MurJ [Coriobacteriales bacterium]